jgi:hypothetical protein
MISVSFTDDSPIPIFKDRIKFMTVAEAKELVTGVILEIDGHTSEYKWKCDYTIVHTQFDMLPWSQDDDVLRVMCRRRGCGIDIMLPKPVII